MPRPVLALLLTAALFAAACAPPPGATSSRPSPRRTSVSPGDVEGEYQRLRKRAEEHRREQMARVERVARRLREAVPSARNVEFVVAQDPSINAGATFGQVAVTTGMLDFVQSDDEMAVVLGHEMAHITEGHVTKGALSGLALNVLAIFLEAKAPGAGRAAGAVGQLFLNHYTQNQERDADAIGLRYAYQAGYDPRAMIELQERLAVAAPETLSAGFFDSHPSSPERAVNARNLAGELLAEGPPPGREEALALERAASSGGRERRSARERAEDEDNERAFRSTAESRTATADARRGDEERPSSEACDRAASYVARARDTSDPAERDELYRRARRYCPEVAERDGGRLRERGRDEPEPERY